MSAATHRAPGVLMTLLKKIFVVVTVAVGVLSFPTKLSIFPPTVNRFQCVSALSDLILKTILP